ncbi:MAG: DUF1565 domain-containing protein [Phycisphaerae bacterium]|nr:DUF1565 domain-containing protein [Phycisphaerae bacterium]
MARFLLTMVIAVCLVVPVSVQAQTWFVRKGGNDLADGKTAATAFQTITRAAGMLNHGDSIVIGPGEYKETVLIAERFSADGAMMAVTGDESGKLTGDPAGPVVLMAARPKDLALTFHRMDGLVVSGLTFKGPGQGLKFDKCRNAAVQRCTFDGLSRGLVVSNSDNTLIESSVFARNIIGLLSSGSTGTRVHHVTIAGSTSVGLLALTNGVGEIRNSILTANNTNWILDGLSSRGWSSDHNVLVGTTGGWGDVPTVSQTHEWPAASGQDYRSVFVVPAFANPDTYDLRISPEVTWAGGLPGRWVGKAQTKDGKPAPVLDRDGKAFAVANGKIAAGAYEYPEAKLAKGWVKLDAKIEGAGSRQSAGVFKENGELVRTLLADASGVVDLYWDGLDDLGQVAPAGKYIAKMVASDMRVVDDGAFGDNGNPMGAYHCDNASRVAPLTDGGFLMVTYYDEAAYPVRQISATGQPTAAIGLAGNSFSAIATMGDDDVYGIVGLNFGGAGYMPHPKLVRMTLPGDRAHMLDGSEQYEITTAEETDAQGIGLAVIGERAYVTLGKMNVVRVIDLTNGKKVADWPVADVSDIAADPHGGLWVLSGNKVIRLTLDGKKDREFDTGLANAKYIAASKDRVAVNGSSEPLGSYYGMESGLVVMDTQGKLIKKLGSVRVPKQFTPVDPNVMRGPRGMCFLVDGRLVISEAQRTRILDADSGTILQDLLSNFMDQAVAHPTKPEYVYCGLGVFRVDTRTGSWDWLVEEPRYVATVVRDEKEVQQIHSIGSPSASAVLGGRPFIAYFNSDGSVQFLDVTDPDKPRISSFIRHQAIAPLPYFTVAFTKDGSLMCAGARDNWAPSLISNRVQFKGLDANNDPIYDLENLVQIGGATDDVLGAVSSKLIVTVDRSNDDIYYGAITALHNKMVPAWGADATGVAKTTPDGRPLWFALSSGGNYMSVAAINDGKQTFILAGKSFGGQTDVFDPDGLRLGTGNWSFPTHYTIGFVDLRYGVSPYIRPDGKVGAYVEDDAIGRFARLRLDGTETIKRNAKAFDWKPTGAAAGEAPLASEVKAKGLEKVQEIPKVASLPVGGDWAAWEKAGVVPQIIALPTMNYKHCTLPDDLWQTMSIGTAIGALAHDGKNLYCYFVVTDEPQVFDVTRPSNMFEAAGVELWLEQDQFGLSMTKDEQPHLFKYRYHNREGHEWAANYELEQANVYAVKLSDVGGHPLGKQLGDIVGVSLKGRKGYMAMGKIPMEEVKLVGGIAGRGGQQILNMTGKGGEVLRIAVAFGGNMTWGRSQDYKVAWPNSMMFSDPTRSSPFVLKE